MQLGRLAHIQLVTTSMVDPLPHPANWTLNTVTTSLGDTIYDSVSPASVTVPVGMVFGVPDAGKTFRSIYFTDGSKALAIPNDEPSWYASFNGWSTKTGCVNSSSTVSIASFLFAGFTH